MGPREVRMNGARVGVRVEVGRRREAGRGVSPAGDVLRARLGKPPRCWSVESDAYSRRDFKLRS